MIVICEPDSNNQHAFADDIFRAEGIFFFQRVPITRALTERFLGARLVVLLAGEYDSSACDALLNYAAQGGSLMAFSQCRNLLSRFGVEVGDARSDAWIVTPTKVDMGVPSKEDLFCPGRVVQRISCQSGSSIAQLRSSLNEDLGPAILSLDVGKGRALFFAYDPVATIINLRHGLDDFDPKPCTRELRGPRHIHAVIGMAGNYTQQVPICDVHMDLLRTLVFDLLAPVPLPRVWHFPKAAPSIYFIKSDGCGENGIDKEIELAEAHGAKVSFHRNLPSKYSGKDLRSWHARGHGIGIELNINSITYGKTLAQLGDAEHELIRSRMREFADDFDRELGVKPMSVCIHSCQWTGARMVRLLQEQGWKLADHFCGHDPRKNRHNYGPYTISSTMPMRYYDPHEGVMDFYLQPTLYDESQAVGWVKVENRGESALRTGFDVSEYAAMMRRFVREAVEIYHVMQVTNWHPMYLMPELLKTEMAAFYNRDAFIKLLELVAELNIACLQIEEWTRFVLARDGIVMDVRDNRTNRGVRVELKSEVDIRDLTLLFEHLSGGGSVTVDGREVELKTQKLEGRMQPYIVVELAAGRTLTVELVPPAGGNPRAGKATT